MLQYSGNNEFRIDMGNIIDSLPEPVLCSDLDGSILYANQSALILFNLNKEQLPGIPLNKLINDFPKENIHDFVNNILNKSENLTVSVYQNNKQIYFDVSISQNLNIDNFSFYTFLLKNATKRIELEESYDNLNGHYKNLADNISDSFWYSERSKENRFTVHYSTSFEQLTGFSVEEFNKDSRLWFKIIFNEDILTVKEKLKAFFKDQFRTSGEIECRIVNKMNKVIWTRTKINLVRDEKGHVTKIYGILSDISASKALDENYSSYSERLQELNRAKDKFISIISHDLRIPFNSILGFTDILLTRKNISEDDRIKFIQFIKDSSVNMLNLVDNLMEWAKFQTGSIKIEKEKLNAHEISDTSIKVLTGSALAKDIKIYNLVEKEIYVEADQNLIFQVLNNLISNAVKFTNRGGMIELRGKVIPEKRMVEFTVKDTGVGIKSRDIAKLFQIDAKFSKEGTEGEKGNGLGLAICKEIIEKHGGEIRVESRMNYGSKFIFTLPLFHTSILLVDDTKADRVLYTKLLKHILPKYTVQETDNAKEALKIIEQTQPNIIITDHLMPLMNGCDLVKKLRDSKLSIKPQVIVISNYLNNDLMKEYEGLDVDYIFQKPVDINGFKEALGKSLKNYTAPVNK